MNTSEVRPTRPSLVWPIVGFVVILAAGVLIGMAVERQRAARSAFLRPPVPVFPGTEPTPAERKRFIGAMASELQLTDAQRVQVEAMIERNLPRVRAIGDSVRLMVESAMREPRTELMKILTPDQQRRFEGIMSGAGGRGVP